MKQRCVLGWFAKATLLFFSISAQGEDFQADASGALRYNESLRSLRGQLAEAFQRAEALSAKGAEEEVYQELLEKVKGLQKEILQLEEKWHRSSVQQEEEYALWDMGETTLSQLIMEYGAADFLYVIPPELSAMKISLFSNIPLPRESWNEMIDLILYHNGVGAKKINSYVKQLYILKLDPSAVEGIVDQEKDLDLFPPQARLFFVLSPPGDQLKAVQSFFERFSDAKQAMIQVVGSKVVLVASRQTLENLLGLYHAVWEKNTGKVVRLVALTKIAAAEAEKVLKATFSEGAAKGRPGFYPGGVEEIATLTLPQGIVLIGESDTVERGARILSELELQMEDPGENIVYWYVCKHSPPEEIAQILDRVYGSLIGASTPKEGAPPSLFPEPVNSALERGPSPFQPALPAGAPFVQPGVVEKNRKTTFGHFVADVKTNAILMVVRREELSKIKSLLKKLDVPKKMVQLDVLLVEKRLTDRKQVGFNILQIGQNSAEKKETALSFDTGERSLNKGIFSFLFSHPKGDAPAMNMAYNFLLAQDDIRINANPSVLTVNQTPATVSIVEEISINNGAVRLEGGKGSGVEQSYTRAQYGITITLTPTIHFSEEEEKGFVTLVTDLEFDTTQALMSDRPPVTRRHIENEVCIGDGETVILGGLRRKVEEEGREKIPFLGDIPGIGKLFGATKVTDTNTEMFIFITPRIIQDGIEDLRKIRQAQAERRAGDLPEFLRALHQAREGEKRKVFQDSLHLLFDGPKHG